MSNKLEFIGQPEIETIEALWREGVSRGDIADAVGIRTRQLETLKAKGMINVPKRQGKGGGQQGRPPSPSEIKRACREVQARWTPEEEHFAVLGQPAHRNALKLQGERLEMALSDNQIHQGK